MKYTLDRQPGSLIRVLIDLTPTELGQKPREETFLDAFADVLKEEPLIVLTPPQFKVLREEPFQLEITFTTKPKLEVPSYKTLNLPPPSLKPVTEDDVNYVLKLFARQFSQAELVNRAIEAGDTLLLNYEGRDKEGIIQMTAKQATVTLGLGDFLPELEEAVIGAKKGDHIQRVVCFPMDYFKTSLRGIEVYFTIEIKDVFILHLPALDDSFAKAVLKDPSKNLKDLKDQIRQDLEKKRRGDLHAQKEQTILEAFIQGTSIELPEALIQGEIEHLMASLYRSLEEKEEKPEEYEAQLKKENRDPRIQLRKQAERNLILRFALDEVFKAPEFEVSEAELVAILEKEMTNLSPEQQEKVRKAVQEDSQHLDQLKREIQMAKLINLVS